MTGRHIAREAGAVEFELALANIAAARKNGLTDYMSGAECRWIRNYVDSLRAQLEAAEADRDGWKAQVFDEISANLAFRERGGALPDEDMPTFCARLIDRAEAAEAEVARLRKDAFRYKFIRSESTPNIPALNVLALGALDRAVDAAIDAAAARTKETAP